ncbi:tRNA (adenine(58)-N(1))-methyltransferase catalytic subunit TRMT61A [Onthophagus taurus]|uniref:tRNA (adenine(58)-N(1))-methyltransferase catalytic subunit TRMT61A n=1 Tax=Onthophagus taurus TaxID=166361 RepID=UPI000C20DCA1|nr:tRNA (adenine(58)-N(1))-methyltransferase catalytic subunit TRMT61A [Onthophagus taurus]
MSFDGFKKVIEESDTVILYLTIHQVYAVKAEPKTKSKKGVLIENVFQTPYGALKCGDLIGKDYGSKITLSKGWGYVLQPTPELWTLTLPHRTQIIYTPDASMIVLQLELNPGSIVIESGTGSGSLSHALIRAVKPHGHLYTFDFHENRVNIAKDEFYDHGLQRYVTVQQRDVCTDGFGTDLDHKADAVFLDLPHPWLAIPHALNSLKETGGRICSFSPCIEQVQKACLKLKELGFQELQTVEVLQSQYNVQTKSLNMLNLEFLRDKKTDMINDNDDTRNKDGMSFSKTLTSIAPSKQAGHTGFLTFATLPPIWARNIHLQIQDDNDNVMRDPNDNM